MQLRTGKSTASSSSAPAQPLAESAAVKIALLPGDGIGPEVLAQARKVLDVLRGPDFTFEAVEAPVGGAACETCGRPLPEAKLRLALESDAVLFGAVGDARFDDRPSALRSTQAIIDLRTQLGLFASLRQIAVPPALASISRRQ